MRRVHAASREPDSITGHAEVVSKCFWNRLRESPPNGDRVVVLPPLKLEWAAVGEGFRARPALALRAHEQVHLLGRDTRLRDHAPDSTIALVPILALPPERARAQ